MMRMDRRSFMAAIGSTLASSKLLAEPSGGGKPYGSGSFGEWMEDEFGLPAFRYTCDQIHDPKAATRVSPGILSSTDHIHQVGNDRLVAVVSNYGIVQVRQDEGAPKFLNDYAPERGQYGGGIGYLTDGKETLSTYYPGNGKSFERVFGSGYFRKRVTGASYSLDQVIAAPFGDDPVILSQVTITNHGKSPAKLRWVEYWGCQPYQFSFRSFIETFTGAGSPVDLRRKLGDRFAHGFAVMEGRAGLMESKRFLGRLPAEEAAFEKMKASLAAHPNPFLGPIQDTAAEGSFDDLEPPPTFLVSLDQPADGYATDAKKFFGAGGAAAPSGLESPLDGDLAGTGPESGLLLERAFTLAPGARKTLYFLYGYLPVEASLNSLVDKYRSRAASVWAESSAQWKQKGLRFDVAGQPWIRREVAWHNYYLRSAFTYDDYFREHIVSQGSIYQYVMGFQGAARDPLQHALPFIFSDPQLMKEVLRYTLKEVRADGSIPYSIVGHGTVMPAASDNSSDIPLWLLWAASEYVLATRDTAFLEEQVPTFPLYGPKAGKETAGKLLARCFRHLVEDVGTGEHGVMRMLADDWNDALVSGWALRARPECIERGESVLNSAMAAYVFDYYARMLSYAGETTDLGARARQKADEHRIAARNQWTGKWLRRAWLGPTLGWLGEAGLWLEPQPWAVIGGVTTPEQTRALVQTVDELLRRPSPMGAMQMNKSPDSLEHGLCAPGEAVNGGIWPSLNATLVWALALVDGKMAWDEWLKNSLARHGDIYPDVWYGTWSGPDTLNSTVSPHPGETVNSGYLHYADYPVMNMHAHACSLYSLIKVLGVDFTEDGVRLAPGLPVDAYRFESPLLGLVKSSSGYEGWYSPSRSGTWTIRLSVPAEEARWLPRAEVNGARIHPSRSADGWFEFKGPSAPARPLRWSLRKG
jgi:hypothetical protein